MKVKKKSEILFTLVQLLKPREYDVPEKRQQFYKGYIDALEWVLSMNKHSIRTHYGELVRIKNERGMD